MLVNAEKENEESAKDKDCLSVVDLVMAAKLKQQQGTSNLLFICQKLQTRKKTKMKK